MITDFKIYENFNYNFQIGDYVKFHNVDDLDSAVVKFLARSIGRIVDIKDDIDPTDFEEYPYGVKFFQIIPVYEKYSTYFNEDEIIKATDRKSVV